MGIGAVDTTDRLSMRMLGMHGAAFANYAVDDCDLLLAIGARFDDRVAGNPTKFAANAKFIAHFDIDGSEINKVKRVDWSHVGWCPTRSRRSWITAGAGASSAIGPSGTRTATNCARNTR